MSGPAGGKFHVVLRPGASYAGEGVVMSPDAVVLVSDADLVALATGQLDGTLAFLTGRIKVTGSMALASQLRTVLTTMARV